MNNEQNKYKTCRKYLVALDLELNPGSWKIIQVGAVIGDIETGNIVERYSCIINPKEELSYCSNGVHITDLTGITQEQVNKGYELGDAYIDIVKMAKKWGAFINCITWGQGDMEALKKQLEGSQILALFPWAFGRRHIDAKTVYISYRMANELPPNGGLAKACNSLGMPFQGRKHDALDDATNTFKIYYKLLKMLENSNV